MAVKNARNFVRDVNTRKICYSFCHPKMAFLSSRQRLRRYKEIQGSNFGKLSKIVLISKSILFHQIHAFFSMILARAILIMGWQWQEEIWVPIFPDSCHV